MTSLLFSNIPGKDSITYLGIVITKDGEARCNLNFDLIIDKTQKKFKFKFNQWLQRSRLSLDVNKKVSKDIDKKLFNFIWRNKNHYIKKSVIMNSYDKGGLNLLDFYTLNNTFKVNWLKQFIKSPSSIWNLILNFIFSKLGGLEDFRLDLME